MKKVAVFGNAGGGKSTLSKRLADITGLPLYPIDIIQFRQGQYWRGEERGGRVAQDEFLKIHGEILSLDRWIIDGYGSVASAWERFAAADTLVYIDLPLATHYQRVIRRLIEGLFQSPEGWPANSPLWISTLDSLRVVWRCHRRLTPKYRQFVAQAVSRKRVHHLRSAAAVSAFLREVANEQRC